MWTFRDVEDRLRECLVTLRRVPGKGIYPSSRMVFWPDIARSYWEAYNTEPARRPRLLATAQDLAEMDEALGWIAQWLNTKSAVANGLPDDVAHIVWMRAEAVPWHRIVTIRLEYWAQPARRGGKAAIPGGNSYPSLTKAYRGAINLILAQLHAQAGDDPIEADAVRLEERVEVSFPGGAQVEMREGKPVVRTLHARAQWGFHERKRRGGK